MFCPNCGSQNPEAAVTCGKCGFNLKGGAAPKFKGTMLMVNSPVAGKGPGAPESAPAPTPAPAAPPKPNMKGTIVGVAPPAIGSAAPPQQFAPPVPMHDPNSVPIVPPGGAEGVNPMGSTFVSDQGPPPGFPPPSAEPPPGAGMGGYGPPPGAMPGGYGPPPTAPSYGAPDPGMGGYGPPPAAPAPAPMAAPPAPMAAPGPGYAPPPDPMMMGGPSPGGAMVPAGNMNMAPAGGGGPMMSGGPLGTIRNPITLLLISAFCCPYYGLYQCMKIEEELNKFTGKSQGGSILWMLFPLIPILGMPKLIAEARQKAGTPTQGEANLILYIFIGLYAFPKDANEIWQQLGAKPG